MVALFHLVSRKSRKWILVGIQGPSENEDRNTSFTLSEKYILDNSGLFDQLDANLIYGRPRSSLYVSQIVLTPSAWNIVSNIDSSLEKWEAPTMNKSLQWLNLHSSMAKSTPCRRSTWFQYRHSRLCGYRVYPNRIRARIFSWTWHFLNALWREKSLCESNRQEFVSRERCRLTCVKLT